ncbi:hypothetical protein H5399_14395 [Tessaracoccus sp. MC1627]|uniref:hypothetical protein n=1 Tax=Tessaracoccus sp. MC1627 TaxID=2760312 RepID=UPI0016020424|nr:hypothetical protein [Tessaracoccus sp. MC1627]MBB1513780.1 hypothetical protein [Tessaracoccus sp. MC1627]
MTEQRDLAEILRSTCQRVIGAADLILQSTQPATSIIEAALDALDGDIRVQTDPTRWEMVPAKPAPHSYQAIPSAPSSNPTLPL